MKSLRSILYIKKGISKGKKNPNYKHGKCVYNRHIKYFCLDCSKELSKGIYKRCHSCNLKYRHKKEHFVVGNKNGRWLSGKSLEEYGSEFDNALKEQIRFRDKYTCQLCGCSQLENGKQLDVHHIDYDKKNNVLSNLIALCWRCHRKTNHRRDYWEQYFKEKYGIFTIS